MREQQKEWYEQPDCDIDLEQPWQRRWWSKELAVSEEELIAAIRSVGCSSYAVRRHLATTKRQTA
jgi:hypothetical protein